MSQPLATDVVDLLLGRDNDLVFADGDFQFVRGVDGVAQLCRIAVQMFAGEWFLDLDLGIPYWDLILGQNPDVADLAARASFREALLGVPGVLRIIFLDVNFDGDTRQLTVSWQVSTAVGDTSSDTLSFEGGQ